MSSPHGRSPTRFSAGGWGSVPRAAVLRPGKDRGSYVTYPLFFLSIVVGEEEVVGVRERREAVEGGAGGGAPAPFSTDQHATLAPDRSHFPRFPKEIKKRRHSLASTFLPIAPQLVRSQLALPALPLPPPPQSHGSTSLYTRAPLYAAAATLRSLFPHRFCHHHLVPPALALPQPTPVMKRAAVRTHRFADAPAEMPTRRHGRLLAARHWR